MKTQLLLFIIAGISMSFILSGFLTDDAFASIYFDKSVYTWTDKINIRITEHGIDSENTSVRIHTSNHELNNYKLSKAGNGLYTGEIVLTGFPHDVDDDGKTDTNPKTEGSGPNNGYLQTSRDDEVTISIRFGDGDKIAKSAKINWNVGDISYDRVLSDSHESIHIQINDIDMNLNPETLDKIPIHAFSDSDKAGITTNAIETHAGSGMFETVFSFSSDSASNGHNLFSLTDDKIYVQYNDHTLPKPYGINDDMQILAEITPITPSEAGDRKIEWSQFKYAVEAGMGTAKIIVRDSDSNTLSDSVDTLQVLIFSDSFREGITLDLYETQKDSGIFERTFTFSDKRSAPNILYALEGDTVSAHYSPKENVDTESKNTSIAATMLLGLTGPPLERTPVTLAKITNVFGDAINEPVIGEQVQIMSDITNEMNQIQKFAYIMMIQNKNGTTEHLAWIDGTLNPKSKFSPSASWMPQKEGKHTATMFVWESMENPSALSPPITIEFTVISKNTQQLKDNSKGEHVEQFLYIMPQKEFKASSKDWTKMHFYSITDKQELSKLPHLNTLVDRANDVSNKSGDMLGLRVSEKHLEGYALFFTQKCAEQRQHASVDTCFHTEWAFEYDEQWYLLHSQLAPPKSRIADYEIEPDYLTQK